MGERELKKIYCKKNTDFIFFQDEPAACIHFISRPDMGGSAWDSEPDMS